MIEYECGLSLEAHADETLQSQCLEFVNSSKWRQKACSQFRGLLTRSSFDLNFGRSTGVMEQLPKLSGKVKLEEQKGVQRRWE
jgi:hypothetical protein